jgi:hypothetical protein
MDTVPGRTRRTSVGRVAGRLQEETAMFIQVITGQAIDREGLLRLGDRWNDELRPGATGFLGSAAGVTDDGRFIAVVRFESEAAARRNSERSEQGAWWAETEKCLDGVAFAESAEIITMLGGAVKEAGFVQVMRGRITDPQRMAGVRERMGEMEAALRRHRPDVLGDVIAVHADGSYTDTVYFQSEAAARQGERGDMPEDVGALFNDLMSAITVDEYLDLKDPSLT